MNNSASPWVYIFSRFTSEALLFEALIIFTLCALYTGFWLLRKRKFGVIQKEVPAGVVKYYLNELIVDAEQLRAQLFGLLSGKGVPATPLAGVNLGTQALRTEAPAATGPAASAPISIVAGDPQSAQTLAALELKLAEQAKQIENFIAEKARIETQLAEAKAQAESASSSAPASGGDDKLKEKLAQLEAKLAEYSVIEDDLANLKRLAQENTALKTQLAGKAAAPETAAPQAEAAPAATAPEQAKTPEQTTAPEQTAAPEQATAAKPAVTSTEPKLEPVIAKGESGALGESGFEGLVDQVEKSLEKAPEAPQSVETAAAQQPLPSTEAKPAATMEKSDADLVAEFEKMLNG